MKNDYEIRGDVTAIYLNRKGTKLETLISTSDLEKVKEFPNTWCVIWNAKTRSFYVTGNLPKTNGKRGTVRLHRYILDDPKGLVIDHINHDTLDNTRDNLRAVTNSENIQNRHGANRNNTSGVRGVSWHKQHKKWSAHYGLNGKLIHLGLFDDIKEAEKVVNEARKKYMRYAN
jgi:hypothetical protein